MDRSPEHIPAHIPDAMVMSFNLFRDPLFQDELHGGIARLAAEQRDIIWSPANGGHWVVLGRDAAFEASTDVAIFSNSAHHRYPDLTESQQIPISLDPPEHGKYRKVLTEIFSAGAVVKFDAQVRDQTNALIDAVIENGGCDFARDLAEPLPVLLFMRLMGFPTARFAEFRSWVLTGLSEPDPVKRQMMWDNVNTMSEALIEERQVERQDDLISRLLDADIDGRPPTMEEMKSFCLMLFIAGLDTVTNAMSLTMRHLAIDRMLQDQLRAEPKLITPAIEELLRRYSANTVQRFVAQDCEFYGARLRKGDYVLIHYPAANLDPRGFPDPTHVDLSRKAPHLAFGAGVHRCVGAQLARVEMKAMFTEWLRRVPPFRLDPDHDWAYHTGYVFSIDSLPLIWR